MIYFLIAVDFSGLQGVLRFGIVRKAAARQGVAAADHVRQREADDPDGRCHIDGFLRLFHIGLLFFPSGFRQISLQQKVRVL